MRNAVIGAVLIASSLVLYQNCGESSGPGLSDLGSGGGATPPSLTMEPATINLTSGQTNFDVSGSCNPGSYSTYYFEFTFALTGYSTRPAITCSSGRYTATLTTTSLGITNQNGTLTGRLVGTATSGEVASSPVNSTINAGGGSGGGTTTCPNLSAGYVRCSGGAECAEVGAPATGQTASSCKTLCQTRGAKCCEFQVSTGTCYPGTGTGCALTAIGDTHWQSAACN